MLMFRDAVVGPASRAGRVAPRPTRAGSRSGEGPAVPWKARSRRRPVPWKARSGRWASWKRLSGHGRCP